MKYLITMMLLVIFQSLKLSNPFLFSIQFKNKLFRTHLDCVNLYPIDNKGEDADTDTDAVAYEMLRSVESRSPSRFENQRVGCILIRNRDGFRVMNATNTFNNNVGVHAELNAISQFLKILPLSSDPLQMVVTFSPCIDCAQLIRFLGDITNVSYCFKYDEGGIG
jgi:tRNA(Arg) A34 adenosine deaminase TadA